MKKTIHVVAAIIRDKGKLFATQRGYGEWKDYWEFPGGKIEQNETGKQALHREILEELDTEISIGDLFSSIDYDYPYFHLKMDCYLASVKKGNLILKEHKSAKWLGPDELDTVNWLPADKSIIDLIKNKSSVFTHFVY